MYRWSDRITLGVVAGFHPITLANSWPRSYVVCAMWSDYAQLLEPVSNPALEFTPNALYIRCTCCPTVFFDIPSVSPISL